MRMLDFVVTAQSIAKAPECDFSGLVIGSKGHLSASFAFSSDWAGYMKVAVFENSAGQWPVPLYTRVCYIPDEALTEETFKVYVVGRHGDSEITTHKNTVIQRRR